MNSPLKIVWYENEPSYLWPKNQEKIITNRVCYAPDMKPWPGKYHARL